MTRGYTIEAYVTWRAGMELKHGRMIYGRGPIMEKLAVKLRYDGRFDFIEGDNRQWTILTHHIGPDGADYFKSSRIGAGSLQALGIIPADRKIEATRGLK